MGSKNCTDMLRKLIREIIAEPLSSGSKFVVKSDEGNSFLLKSNGNMPWTKNISNDLQAFSVYKIHKTDEDKVDPIQIIKSLKEPSKKGNIKIPTGTIGQILEKSSDISSNWLKDLHIDLVTTPQSSKTLAVRFGKLMSQKLGTKFLPAGTLKNFDVAEISPDLPASYSERSKSGLQKSLNRLKSSEKKELHKHFHPRDRKFVKNWQQPRETGSDLSGLRILLVDDVLSDGNTFREMSNVLSDIGAEVVGCLTLFKTNN